MVANVAVLGIDSFLACAGMGLYLRDTRQRVAIAAALAVGDGWATFAAARHGARLTCASLGLVLALFGWAGLTPRRRAMRLAPALLSMDNLLSPLAEGDAPAAALGSFAMAAWGFVLSAFLLRIIPERARDRVAWGVAASALVAVVVR